MSVTKKFKKYEQDVINDYGYVDKILYDLKLSMPYNIGVANLFRMWCST